jgi:ABC-type antimicrobial peptide transport system permease subunit
VIVLDDALWRQRFGADPTVIGRTVILSGQVFEIIGVLSPDFRFPSYRQLFPVPANIPRPQLWKPFGLQESERTPVGSFNYICIAKLKAGVSLAQATSELERIQASMAMELPQRLDLGATVTRLQAQIVERSRAGLTLLLAAVGTVLLIGCINIASLLLARTVARRRELAVRRALGADRGRIVRQILVESFTLCGFGALGAVGVAYAAIPLIIAVAPADVPRLDEVALDLRVLLFTLAVSCGMGVLIGVAPAWRSATMQLMEAMTVRPGGTTSGPRRGRTPFVPRRH